MSVLIDIKNNNGWVHISQLTKKKSAINIHNLSAIFKKPNIFSQPIAKLEKEGRDITNVEDEEFPFSDSVTVKDVIVYLGSKYGEAFSNFVLNIKNPLKLNMPVLVNGKAVDMNYKLKDKDVFVLLPAISGGL